MSECVVGSFEHVSFPDLGIVDTVAKIDTGAYTGAIHCSEIVFERIDGRPILKFKVNDGAQIVYRERFRRVRVRSTTGHETNRFIINTTINLQAKDYPISITLADRKAMKYPILLGRRFLREHNMLVDSRINQEFDQGEDNTK